MSNQVTAHGICEALKSTTSNGLSAKAIAMSARIDTTSENLRKIEDECWDMVNAGLVEAIDRRDQKNGALFFSIK